MTNHLESLLLTPLEEISRLAASEGPWDAVVVGAGTAGLTAARCLAERGRRVAVLEGGPLALLTHSTTTDLRFDRDAMRKFRQSLEYSPRLGSGGGFGELIACVGGRGLFWNGAAPRFNEHDFRSWPFALADLAEHYAWAEGDLRINTDYGAGPLGQLVIRMLRRAGLPARPCPFAVDTRDTRDGWIGGTLGNPMAPLLRSGVVTRPERKLRLSTRALVTRLILDGGRVSAIATRDAAGGGAYEIPARSVVLAAGGTESVRLAMVSKVPDASGTMGTGLSDHLFCRAYYNVPPEYYDPARPESAIVHVPAVREGTYQLELHLPGDNIFTLNEHRGWRPARTRDYAAMVRSFAPTAPRRENRVEPGPTDNPGDFTVHFAYADADRALIEQMRAGLEATRVALGADPAEVDVRTPGASHHEAGGLAMGHDPAHSVTDAFGRFHAVKNLVAADASAWPSISAANPYLTITAVARRQALALAASLS